MINQESQGEIILDSGLAAIFREQRKRFTHRHPKGIGPVKTEVEIGTMLPEPGKTRSCWMLEKAGKASPQRLWREHGPVYP